MVAKRFEFVEIIANEVQAGSSQEQAFLANFQEGLLLSLLKKDLLTRWQFDRCMEGVKKTKGFKNNSCL